MASRYQRKIDLLFNNSSLSPLDPLQIPDIDWIDDPRKWPKLEFGQMYLYLIESPGQFTKEKLKAYKSLQAYNYYISGWVQTVFLFFIPGTDKCILKAKVKPSQRMNDHPHIAWVGLQLNGDIINAHCSCMAGLGETCSHVAAILFKVEAFIRLELGKSSCTSLPCVWNQTFTKNVKPARADDIKFFKPRHQKSTSVTATGSQSGSSGVVCELDQPQLDKKKFLDALFACSPNSAIFSVTYGYTDMSLVAVEADTEVNLPMQLFDLYQPSYSQLPLTDLSQVVATTFNKYLRVTQAECDFLESSTRGQSSSYLWHDYRRGLITSSHFHSVLHHTGRAYPTSIVQTIMQYKSLSSHIPSLKWGREHEDIARKEYAKYMITHASFTVQESGLVINASYPFIGASPDGIVNCQCCGQGLLEIKCPFKYREMSPTSEEALLDRNYFLKKDSQNEIHLSTSHAYYHQVQGQMAVKQLHYCDFVCWTAKGLFVERIHQDKDYAHKYVPRFKKFFLQYILPEILTHKHRPSNGTDSLVVSAVNTATAPTNGNSNTVTCSISAATPSTSSVGNPPAHAAALTSSALKLSDSTTSNAANQTQSVTKEKVYCICQEDRSGRMIACDNPLCTVEWYHYVCIGIKRAPKGKWYCPRCR